MLLAQQRIPLHPAQPATRDQAVLRGAEASAGSWETTMDTTSVSRGQQDMAVPGPLFSVTRQARVRTGTAKVHQDRCPGAKRRGRRNGAPSPDVMPHHQPDPEKQGVVLCLHPRLIPGTLSRTPRGSWRGIKAGAIPNQSIWADEPQAVVAELATLAPKAR